MTAPRIATNIWFIAYDDEDNICYAGRGDLKDGELYVDSCRHTLRKGIDGKEPVGIVYRDGREVKAILVDKVHYQEFQKDNPIKTGVRLWFREIT